MARYFENPEECEQDPDMKCIYKNGKLQCEYKEKQMSSVDIEDKFVKLKNLCRSLHLLCTHPEIKSCNGDPCGEMVIMIEETIDELEECIQDL